MPAHFLTRPRTSQRQVYYRDVYTSVSIRYTYLEYFADNYTSIRSTSIQNAQEIIAQNPGYLYDASPHQAVIAHLSEFIGGTTFNSV
jgi:hypothetical protein